MRRLSRGRDRRHWSVPVLILALTGMLLGAAAATLGVIYSWLVRASGDQLAAVAGDIADGLDRVLHERQGNVQVMASVLADRLHDPAWITRYLWDVHDRYGMYRWLGVADAEGRLIAATDPASVGANRRDATWFRDARGPDGIRIADYSPEEENVGVRTVGLAAPIVGADGRTRGVVAALVALSELEDFGARLAERLQAGRGPALRIEYQYATVDGDLVVDSLLREEGRTNLLALGVASARLAAAGQRGSLEEPHGRLPATMLTGYARTEGDAESAGLNWIVLVRMDRDDVVAPIVILVRWLAAVGAGVTLPLFCALLWSAWRLRAAWRLSEERGQIIERSETRIRALLDSAGDGIYGVDRNGRCIFINHAGAAMLGYAQDELIGKIMSATILRREPEGRSPDGDDCPIMRSIQMGVSQRADDCFIRKDGTSFLVSYTAVPVEEDGGIAGAVVTFRDTTQQAAMERQLREMAHRDALTGLPNRRLFMESVPKALARAKRLNCLGALLFLDLDRFKLLNDTLGHSRADEVLRAVASRLLACVRETDTVARLGGDEFTILLEGLRMPEEAGAIAQRIVNELARPFKIDGDKEVFVTCSVGIAVFPADGLEAETLIANADTAMYEAKQRRGAYRFYSPAMKYRLVERVGIETKLRHALERDELLVRYQPQVNAWNNLVVGVEALIRWRHPDQGIVAPGAFIGVAEEAGLIIPIGDWVLRTACRQVVAWRAAGGPPLRLAVNLSRVQLQHPKLVSMIQRALAETGLAPSELELEITENLLIRDGEVEWDALYALRELGVRLSIDDFGTGYSSLQYLKDLPAQALKIDQSFVRGLPGSAKDRMIVKTIVSLARALQMEVMAEGVETETQREALLAEGCGLMQGYYFGRPMTAEELAARVVPPPRASLEASVACG